MQIKEVMTKDVISVAKDSSISDVAKIMRKHGIHGVPVVEEKQLVGIITETDFFAKGETEIYLPSYIDFLSKTSLAENEEKFKSDEFKKILEIKAGDIMTTECITLNPESEVGEFLKIVKEKSINTVPVVEKKGVLVGIVTVLDVVKFI